MLSLFVQFADNYVIMFNNRQIFTDCWLTEQSISFVFLIIL